MCKNGHLYWIESMGYSVKYPWAGRLRDHILSFVILSYTGWSLSRTANGPLTEYIP